MSTAGAALPARAVPRVSASFETLARVMLGLFVFSGSFVLIEPSPYEMVFIPTVLCFLMAGLYLHVSSMPMVLLLLLFNIGGALALPQVMQHEKTEMYVVISLFMAANAIFFTALLSTNTLQRFAVLRGAYILSAFIAALAGIAGYFDLGGTGEMLSLYNRAKGFFKDPNVYAPFLVLPLVLLLQDMLLGRARTLIFALPPYLVILSGLFLSFSRAAWTHVVLSSALTVFFLLVFSNSARLRLRVVAVSVAAGAVVAIGLVALLSVPAVREVFEIRASLSQDYDVEAGGRFSNQFQGLRYLMDHPLGLGPLQFANIFGTDSHNVFLNAFFAYGWLGGFSYFALIILTWAVGFQALFRPSPYRRPFGAVMATFTVLSLEGIIIDSDHWRHFFLLLGLVWGFIAAVYKWEQEQRPAYLRTTA